MEVVFEVLIRIRETGVRDFVDVSYYFYQIYSLVTECSYIGLGKSLLKLIYN